MINKQRTAVFDRFIIHITFTHTVTQYSWWHLTTSAVMQFQRLSLFQRNWSTFSAVTRRVTKVLAVNLVSEYILNGTSAQLGYTVSFTLLHAGKYRAEDELKIQRIRKLNTTPKKSTNAKHSKTKLAWFSRLLRHSARKWGGLNQQCSWAHMGQLLT